MAITLEKRDPLYRHTYCQPHELRLLQYLPKEGSEELCFEVKKLARDPTTSYVAMSYAWGSTEATEIIELNGAPFYVRSNLKRFLNAVVPQLTTKFAKGFFVEGTTPKLPAGGPVYIWVDAICVDQSNVGERNIQVQLMRDTFSKATCVISWLREAGGNKNSDYLSNGYLAICCAIAVRVGPCGISALWIPTSLPRIGVECGSFRSFTSPKLV